MESTDMQHQQYYHHHWIQDAPVSVPVPAQRQRQRQRQFQHQYYPPAPQTNNHGTGAGLTRFRSAPSSYFDTMKNNMMKNNTMMMESTANTTTTTATTANINDSYDLLMQPVRPLSPETENIFARFIESVSGDQATDFVKHEKPPPPPQPMVIIGGSDSGTGTRNLRGSSAGGGIKIQTGNISNSNLARHRSSPAGLFDDILIENYGWNNSSGSANVGGGNNPLTTNVNNESKPFTCSSSSSSELGQEPRMFNRQINDVLLPPPPPCSSGHNNRLLAAGFPSGSWDDPSLFSDQDEIINRPENQNGFGNTTTSRRGPHGGLLAHRLSLPLEKLAHFQDHDQAPPPPLPCEIRAKRGCATHPRSIAERVRRTKISERMRKLQDLVPNMDKQTNTADMLDLAVEYIKDLQNQVKMLTGKRARCTCSI